MKQYDIGFDQAYQLAMAHVHALEPERLLISEAYDRVAAEDIFARVDSPSVHASTKDGYAVIAADIEAGRFVFAGQAVETVSASPFSVIPPTADWARQLHGFGWLRHLRGQGGSHSSFPVHKLIEDWFQNPGEGAEQAWEPAVVARRTMSFLSQSNLILRGADHDFYQQFIRTLLRQARSSSGRYSSARRAC